MKKYLGFSLIELIFVIAIMGMLSALSIPVYTRYSVNEKRLEAKLTLNKLAAAMENYFSIHHTYLHSSLRSLGFNEKIIKNNYQLFILETSANAFKLAAKPLKTQATRDSTCGTLILYSTGEKIITGSASIRDCWE